jgi:hypothetical protein
MTISPMSNSGSGYNSPLSEGGNSAGTVTRSATVPIEQFTGQVYLRLRGRQVAFKMESTAEGVAWQLGSPRLEMPTITDESSRVVAPALPTGPTTYSKGYIDRFNNILRLYFNQLDNALRNAVATSVPYTLRVAQGQITGATSLFKFGFNGDVDTSEETVWSEGGNLSWCSGGNVFVE